MDPIESKFFLQNIPFQFLGTVRGRFATPDCDDARSFVKRTVTNIPISEQSFRRACNYISDINHGGTSFNFANGNCALAGANMMRVVGIDVDTRMSVGTAIANMLPDIGDIP